MRQPWLPVQTISQTRGAQHTRRTINRTVRPVSNVGEIWRWRFEQNGSVKRVSVRGSMTVNDTDAAIRAALDGLGIVYTLDVLVEPFLRSGSSCAFWQDWSPTWRVYFLL